MSEIKGYKVSQNQREIWDLYREGASCLLELLFHLKGSVDENRFKNSIYSIANNYSIFKTFFNKVELLNFPLQIISKDNNINLVYEFYDASAEKSNLIDFITSHIEKKQNLCLEEHKICILLIKHDEAEFNLAFISSALLCDGYSLWKFADEVFKCYQGENKHNKEKIPYLQFSDWHNSLLEDIPPEIEEFWSHKLMEINTTPFKLPLESYCNGKDCSMISHIPLVLNHNISTGVESLALQLSVEPSTVLCAVLYLLIFRQSNSNTFPMGFYNNKRAYEELVNTLGPISNLFPLAITIKQEDVCDFIRALGNQVNEINNWQEYFYAPTSQKNNTDFKKCDFCFEHLGTIQIVQSQELHISILSSVSVIGEHKLKLISNQWNNTFNLNFLYDTRYFHLSGVTSLVDQYLSLLEEIILTPEKQLHSVGVVTGPDAKLLNRKCGFSKISDVNDNFVIDNFLNWCIYHSDDIILTDEKKALSYRDLSELSESIANYLNNGGDIKKGDRVALITGKNNNVVLGIIGIIKCGAIFVPIDIQNPEDRLKYILSDSACSLILSDETTKEKLEGIGLDSISIDNIPVVATQPSITKVRSDDPLYIMYTSGTTGKPKGVVVEAGSVYNYAYWLSNDCGITHDDRAVMLSSYCFDLAYTAIWGCILMGSKLHIVSDELLHTPSSLLEYLHDVSPTYLKATPSYFNMLIKSCDSFGDCIPPSLRNLFLGGEKIHIDDLKKIINQRPDLTVINHYGPTETTVGVIAHKISIDNLEKYCYRPTIGRPIPNNAAFIANENGFCPEGIVGEIIIQGKSLSRGYINEPELTFKKYNQLKITNSKVYATGDLGRLLPDGTVEFLGRRDNQVKLNGYRIELEEIIAAMRQENFVREAVIKVLSEENAVKLIAYYEADSDYSINEFRKHLHKYVPQYMIPTTFARIESFPLTPNGKIDYERLPVENLNNSTKRKIPQNEIEILLCETWQAVLKKDMIGTLDNFYMLGGDSIKAIQIASRLKKAGYKLDIRNIFEYPTIRQLAPLTFKKDKRMGQNIVEGNVPLTPIQYYFLETNAKYPNHYNQSVVLQTKYHFHESLLETIFSKLQQHHDALRLTFSIGGTDIQQFNQRDTLPLNFQSFDYRNENEGERLFQEQDALLQKSIDLKNGPLMKVGWFKMTSINKLLIIIHHLVIDSVSWRILIEDINSLITLGLKDAPLKLQGKTNSFKQWAESLVTFSKSKVLNHERSYWLNLVENGNKKIGTLSDLKEDRRKNFLFHHIVLDPIMTKNLQTYAYRTLRADVNEILLSALSQAIGDTFEIDDILIALEGHGRNKIFEDLDIDRTIGCFTTLYPVLLKTKTGGDLMRRVTETKGMLRKVPNFGIGYGVLKYMLSDEAFKKITPQVVFNYWGEVDLDATDGHFTCDYDIELYTQSPEEKRGYDLDISCIIKNDTLNAYVGYNKTAFCVEDILSFSRKFKRSLEMLIRLSTSNIHNETMHSDLGNKDLSLDDLDSLNKLFN